MVHPGRFPMSFPGLLAGPDMAFSDYTARLAWPAAAGPAWLAVTAGRISLYPGQGSGLDQLPQTNCAPDLRRAQGTRRYWPGACRCLPHRAAVREERPGEAGRHGGAARRRCAALHISACTWTIQVTAPGRMPVPGRVHVPGYALARETRGREPHRTGYPAGAAGPRCAVPGEPGPRPPGGMTPGGYTAGWSGAGGMPFRRWLSRSVSSRSASAVSARTCGLAFALRR